MITRIKLNNNKFGVKIVVNTLVIKQDISKVNPTENLEHHMNELLNKNYFSRYKNQLNFLAKFSKIGNAEEVVFHKWVKSDFNYNHTQDSIRAVLHNTLKQKLADEHLEGSGFVLNGIVNVILAIYKVNDTQASSWVELPEKYKNNKSIINIINNVNFWFP